MKAKDKRGVVPLGLVAPKGALRAALKGDFYMSWSLYFLQSLKDEGFYIGCSEDPIKRLDKYHNRGKVKSTKSRAPFKLVYFEEYESKTEAYKREYFLKRPSGYQDKLKIIKKILRGVA